MASNHCQVFTSSGTFDVPASVSWVHLTLLGSGGGGGGGSGGSNGAGGGGSAEFGFRVPLKVTPSGTVTVTLGTGGVGGSISGPNPNALGFNGTPTHVGTMSASA